MLQKIFRKFINFSGKDNNYLEKAKQQAKEIILKAEEEAIRRRQEAQTEARKSVNQIIESEKRLSRKEEQLEEKDRQIKREEQGIKDSKRAVESLKEEIKTKKEQLLKKLEKVAHLSKDEARSLLLSGWEEKLKVEISKRIRGAEKEITEKASDKARQILLDAMRYGAIDYVSEYTTSSIDIPNDDYKGRIIGKDGRNIRAFELATGVDVDLEEERVIKLSSFDGIRREVAKLSLKKLIKDGRIQPHRIEEVVKKTREDVRKMIFSAGEDLAHKVDVYNLPRELTELLGRFKYRYSYGQNMIAHTLEETKIGVSIAHELKADVNVVKLGCLFHDIGKVITDKEGSHINIGVDVLKKFHFPKSVIDCVAAHHEDIPFPSSEAVIVYIADAVSGGRPGARHEDFQEYLKRISKIEETAKCEKGVKDVYALQAGRELRVIVKPKELTDDEVILLGEKIRSGLEKKFDVFPGQIKVTVIREFRSEATTKI